MGEGLLLHVLVAFHQAKADLLYCKSAHNRRAVAHLPVLRYCVMSVDILFAHAFHTCSQPISV